MLVFDYKKKKKGNRRQAVAKKFSGVEINKEKHARGQTIPSEGGSFALRAESPGIHRGKKFRDISKLQGNMLIPGKCRSRDAKTK